jgi:hypothetical protein
MKQLASSYSINGATVTLTGVNVPLSQILLVSDATTGNVLYSMAGPAASNYTQASDSSLTLASAPGATDKLTIYYDDGVAVTNGPTSSTNSGTSTFTSTTSAQILASNSNRKGVVLSSPSTNTGVCYITIGTTETSTTAFSFIINPGDIISLTGINNALTGIWSASSNTLYVTELS